MTKIQPDRPVDPLNPCIKPYWVTLGGGVKCNETLEEAALRKLAEGTGIPHETFSLVRLAYSGGELD